MGLPLILIRLGGEHCAQPARDDDDACHSGDAPQPARSSNTVPPVNALANHEILEKHIREFWAYHGAEGEAVQKEVKQLRALLFRRQKHPVSQDIWIPGGSQPGEEQHVEAVVSEMFVLKQIKDVIELRETWLRQNSLPVNCQMRDGFEREDFLAWAKDQFHAQEFQQRRQREDFKDGGKAKVRRGKNSRWNRDLQRRLGTPALWYMVRVRRLLPERTMVSLRASGRWGTHYNGFLSFFLSLFIYCFLSRQVIVGCPQEEGPCGLEGLGGGFGGGLGGVHCILHWQI